MNQKVYYINELGYSSGTHQFDKHRLPQGYIDLLSWHSLGWNHLNEIQGENNIIIIQTPNLSCSVNNYIWSNLID